MRPYDTRQHAQTIPDKIAFHMCATGESVTFAELEASANRGAHVLRNIGVGIGEHIAILMENRRELLELCFAADRAGIYYTTLSTHLTREEITYIVADCAARVLIVSDAYAETIAALRPALPSACALYAVGADLPGCERWETAQNASPNTPIEDEAQGLDMLYSSGTTGRPKGIKWSLTGEGPGEPTMLIDLLTSLFGYGPQTRYLCPAPLYHAAPLRHTMVTIKAGGTAFIMECLCGCSNCAKRIDCDTISHRWKWRCMPLRPVP